jgi:hypothetical protein
MQSLGKRPWAGYAERREASSSKQEIALLGFRMQYQFGNVSED